MSDLIYRQAAIDAVQEALAKMEHSNYFHIWTTTEVRVMVVERILKQLPSAQPEIIRCKDCKYFESCSWSEHEDDGFCKWGERRLADG